MASTEYIWAEALLHEERAARKDKDVLCSEVEIIDLMLERTTEMQPVYENIDRVTYGEQHKAQVLLIVVSTLAVIGTEEFRLMQKKRDRLDELNEEISHLLTRLSEKFEKRDQIRSKYGLTGPDDRNIVDWVKAGLNASDDLTRHRGANDLVPELEALQSRFFGSYWPSSAAMFQGMAAIQSCASEAIGRVMQRSIAGYSGDDRDAVKFLLGRLEESLGSLWKQEAMRATRKLKITPTNLARIFAVVNIHKYPTTIAKAARRHKPMRNSRKRN